MGKSHTQSPFTGIYSQYGFSTKSNVVEEVKKEEPLIAEENKDDTKNDGKKAQSEKKPKAPKEAAQKQNPPKKGAAASAPQSDLSEELQAYLACDLRVGKIVECTRHPESAKLYVEKIDLGEG